MPYQLSNPPSRIRALPKGAQRIWIGAYNGAWRTRPNDEAYCNATAWSQVKKKYKKNAQGKWVLKEEVEMAVSKEALVSIGTTVCKDGVCALTEERVEGAPFRLRGTALIDNSKSGNKRYYTKEFNTKAMEATNLFMENGGVVTIFGRHGKAVGNPLIGQLPEGYPIGRVDIPLYRDNGRIRYEAEIFDTAEGKDAQIIIERGGMPGTSVRMRPWEARPMRLPSGEDVEMMVSAVIIGIDLAEDPGIPGTGIDEVLEEAPTLVEPKEGNMFEKWEDLTAEMLLENRKDLLDAYLEGHEDYKAQTAKITALEGKIVELTQAVEEAKKPPEGDEEAKAALERVPELEETIKGLTQELAIEKAAQVGVSTVIAEELRKKLADDDKLKLEEVLPGIKTAAIATVLAAAVDPTAPPGKGKATIIEGAPDAEPLTEERSEIVRLTGGQPGGIPVTE